MSEPLLDPALLARLENIQLNSRSRLIGRFAGEHRSRRYGTAVDFADFREYVPGDDFRRIDYHVLARLDQLLIKLYESDDELVLRLLVDTSGSMAIGGKLRQAARIAGALGFVALTGHDVVTAHTVPMNGGAPRFHGRGAVPGLFSYLSDLEAAGTTPFAHAAGHLLSQPGPAGMTVVLSDLLTPEWPALVRLRARGSDLVVLHILAPEDTDPELTGDFQLVDDEDGSRLQVSLTPESVELYRSRIAAWQREVTERCHSIGATYVPVSVDDDVERLLLTSWRRAGVVR